MAYLAEHRSAAAAAEFQKILFHSGIVQNEILGALSHLELGRAYTLAGDKDKARGAYHDFLVLWNGAEPDLSVNKQARIEYATLQ
jgi:hypothetical protein